MRPNACGGDENATMETRILPYVKEGHARFQPNAQKLDKAWVKHWDGCLAIKTEA